MVGVAQNGKSNLAVADRRSLQLPEQAMAAVQCYMNSKNCLPL